VSRLTNEQVNQIAERVLGLMQGQGRAPGQPLPAAVSSPPLAPSLAPGIFSDLDAAVAAAGRAHLELVALPLEKRAEIIAKIREKMLEVAEELARKAHSETGLGRFEHKVIKNRLVTNKTPGPEALQPVAYTGDRGLTLIERAPYGVIGAITPVTNPTSTIICNTIGMLSAGNAVVFNVHPGAKSVSIDNIVLLNQTIEASGGPRNLITAIAEPTVESAQALMRHPGVRLLVVTGGAGVVKAAMTSGKRAICAGPGNPPVVIDETADIEQAARDTVFGASLDNNVICIDEKEVFVVSAVADRVIQAMQQAGAALVPSDQLTRLEKVIFEKQNGPRRAGVMNKALIGKNAGVILAELGIPADERTPLVIAEVDRDHPLVWTEQMMPVLPIVRVPDADSAIDLAKQAEHGNGHSASIHSKNLDHLSRMAQEINCSIFVKNGPIAAGLGHGGEGYCSFSIASPTGEGLTDPRSFSRERRCVLVDHFRIV